jgi:geranylgeranyl diphosphate synthase, type I
MKQDTSRIAIQMTMRAAFPDTEARVEQFYAMQHYQLGWRDEQLAPASTVTGKLLRPYLVLLACRAAGGDVQQALPLAAAIQLVHDFTLIHDDIEDQSETRRGRPTVWKLWGLAQGINTGDGLLIVAHLAMHRLHEVGVPAEVALEVIKRFDQTILAVCEGQFLDLSYEGDLRIVEADYLAMISRKTAALVAAAGGLGAIVGGADGATAKALFDFGQNLGLAFQIQDDVLGIWGDPAATGKPAAGDLYRHKLSLPIIHALQHAEQRENLAELYSKEYASEQDVQQILAILDQVGARGYVEGVAAFYHQEALAALDSVRGGNAAARAELRALTEGLVGRHS